MLKIIYTVFLGIMLALFVGVGISVFYPAPTMPEARLYESARQPTPAEEKQYQQEFENYNSKMESYNRSVSLVSLVAAVAILAISLIMATKLDLLADGLLLGGTLMLLYSIGRGLASGQNTYRFMVVSAGLAIALGLGYYKFLRPTPVKSPRAK